MVSIIIAVKNDRRIERTLENLVKSQKPEETDILVIDASKGILDDIKHKFPSVRWIDYQNRTSKRRTFVEQVNLGSELAKGDVLAYIDADCIPEKNWLINLIKPIREENENIVSGRIESIKGNTVWDSEQENIESKKYKAECPTMNMAIKASILDKIGPRDESFGFGSDVDFTWRATELGYKIRYNKNAVIYHDWGSSKDEVKRFYNYGLARVHLYLKHKNKWKQLFSFDAISLVYPVFLIFLPLTIIFPFYPLIIFLLIIKNYKYKPFETVFFHLIYGVGEIIGLFKYL